MIENDSVKGTGVKVECNNCDEMVPMKELLEFGYVVSEEVNKSPRSQVFEVKIVFKVERTEILCRSCRVLEGLIE